MKCMTPKQSLALCTRQARYEFILDRAGTSSDPDQVVYAQCAQHYRSAFGRIMAPPPWEYSRVHDTAAHIDVRRV